MTGIHAVLGAAGTIGSELVGALVARGELVRAVTRGPGSDPPVSLGHTPVEHLQADVATPGGAARAVAGSAVVYVCVQPAYSRWPQEFPTLLSTIADAASRAGARLVLMDNLYAYGPVAGPITEDLPLAATTRKGSVRAAMATDLLARHSRGDLAVSLGRASDFIGARGKSLPNVLVIQPISQGKRGRWIGRLDVAHSLSYVPDVARYLSVLGANEAAFGRAWHLPVAGSPTGRELVELAHATAGITGKPGLVTPLMSRIAGLFNADVREGNELMYEFTEPFVVDDQAFRTAFPDEPGPTSLHTAVAESLSRTITPTPH